MCIATEVFRILLASQSAQSGEVGGSTVYLMSILSRDMFKHRPFHVFLTCACTININGKAWEPRLLTTHNCTM